MFICYAKNLYCPKPVIAEINGVATALGASWWQAVILPVASKDAVLHAWCAYWPVLFNPNGGFGAQSGK